MAFSCVRVSNLAEVRSGSARSRAPRAGGASPAIAAAAVSPARRVAFDLLSRIGATSTHSDDALHGPALAPLSEADRHLTTALVLGVLRWQIALDARIRPFLNRPEVQLPEPVGIALRLGAFQLLHMERIPAHAAVGESVELVRFAGHAHAAGMVNALLRKLATTPPPRRPLVESLPAMSERLGHPLWLVERWTRQFGRSVAEQICAFNQAEPPPSSIFSEVAGDPAFPVMDAGSRLVAELAATVGEGAGRVWDCCAAPGGKTLVLARRLPDAELLATDANPVRLRRLVDRLRRDLPGRHVRTAEARAEVLEPSYGLFDLILCDVPCSGTGTLARNPEIRFRLRPDDLPRQKARQKQILTAAMKRLAPGGSLIYSTCSLEAEECSAVVQEVLGTTEGQITQVPIALLLNQLHDSGRLTASRAETAGWLREECLRTLPGAGFVGDGFFAALFQRQ